MHPEQFRSYGRVLRWPSFLGAVRRETTSGPNLWRLQQEHVVTAGGAVDGHTDAGGASAHDDHVPRLRVRTEAPVHLRSVQVEWRSPSTTAPMSSEHQLQRELALPRRERRADGTEGGIGGFRVRYPEIRVVQDVEELRPELQPGLFANLEVLVNRAIPLVEVGCAERIAADIRRMARWRAEC